MFFSLLVPRRIYRHIPILILLLIAAGLLVCFSPFRTNSRAQAQAYEKELSAGGKAQQCGWLKDKYGLSWQIVPTALPRMLQDKDPEKRQRVFAAMMQMVKIDIAALQRAYDAE